MDTELDMTRPNCTLSEALDMVDHLAALRSHTKEWIFAQVAYTTGWPVGRIEAVYERRYLDWCAHYGYDYT